MTRNRFRFVLYSLTEYYTAFVTNPRFELRKWSLDEDLIDALLEGLRLAGMEL